MAAYDPGKIKQLARQLAEYAQEKSAQPQAVERAQSPFPRLVVPDDFAPDLMCATEREWMCEQIRFLARVYTLDWFVRQETRGYAGLESVPDEELRYVFKRVGEAIDCIKEGVSFEDRGLIHYESEP